MLIDTGKVKAMESTQHTEMSTIYRAGYICELRTARVSTHTCAVCKQVILKGAAFYTIVKGGGGLGWLKFPDRAHPACLDDYFGEVLSNE